MTAFAYLRVSTLEQNTEKNKLEILKFVNDKKLGNVEFVEEQILGKTNFKNRLLGNLLQKMKKRGCFNCSRTVKNSKVNNANI